MNLKFSTQLLLVFLINLMGCSAVVAISEENTGSAKSKNVLPDQKVLESGQVLRRNAGTEWSRKKIKEYLAKIKITREQTSNSPQKECLEAQKDIENLNFKFIAPDLITDDWSDPRLDYYREHFKGFKYGMGYREKFGPTDAQIPDWNINLYTVDTDSDGVNEVILYGEKVRSRLGGSGYSSYRLFHSVTGFKSVVPLISDPSSMGFKSDDHIVSGLIKINNIYATLVISDFRYGKNDRWSKLDAYLLEAKNTYVPELGRSTWHCQFGFVSPLIAD